MRHDCSPSFIGTSDISKDSRNPTTEREMRESEHEYERRECAALKISVANTIMYKKIIIFIAEQSRGLHFYKIAFLRLDLFYRKFDKM